MDIISGNAILKLNNGKFTGFSCGKEEYLGFNPFKICIQGLPEGQFSELTSANCYFAEMFELVGQEQVEGGYAFTYNYPALNVKVVVEISAIGETGTFKVVSSVTNGGANAVEITRFSSAYMSGFGGNISQSTPDYTVHYFESAWQAEARYVKKSIKELGLTFVSTHAMSKSFTLVSNGAYTTAKYFPAMFIQDAKSKTTRFMCAECDGPWRIQLGHSAGYIQQNAGWYLESNAISSSDLGTNLVLGQGESYTAPTVLFGSATGGIDEAIESLTKARRVMYTAKIAPLMFNDYMNCLWCNVNDKITATLAKKAAELGAEGYCIDSGWYAPKENGSGLLGDWIKNDERFGEGGLKATVDYIKDLGLIPGLWTELEVCSENAKAYALPDEYFICSNGKRVGGGERVFFDFRNPKVWDFLTQKVQDLYDLGVRYIKNDFNAALRWITDANVIAENQRAAIAFYKSLAERFPDLYMENCGSGGMRAEYGMLKNFSIQSTSDQEIYYFNPSIVQGMLANILPEHAGVWAFPYPNLFDVREDKQALLKENARQADGRQTVFNMVSGLAGNLYLSGRIEYADEKNSKLISSAINLFKQMRSFKAEASPVYPNGFSDISNLGEFTTLGLINYEKSKMYLFFWRFDGKKTNFSVPLKKYIRGNTSVKRVYPEANDITGEISKDKLNIIAQTPYSAAIFEIDF